MYVHTCKPMQTFNLIIRNRNHKQTLENSCDIESNNANDGRTKPYVAVIEVNSNAVSANS